MYTQVDYENSLYHHGIKGQKWGVRRYQNSDGSYTSAGRERYGINTSANREAYKSGKKQLKNRLYSEYDKHENWHESAIQKHNSAYGQNKNNFNGKNKKLSRSDKKAYEAGVNKLWNDYESRMNSSRSSYEKDLKNLKKETGQTLKGRWNGLSDNQKKALKVGAAVAATGLAAYATYKIAGPKVRNIIDKRNVAKISQNILKGKSASYTAIQSKTYKNIQKFRSSSKVKPITSTNIYRPNAYRESTRWATDGNRVSTRVWNWAGRENNVRVSGVRPRRTFNTSDYRNHLSYKDLKKRKYL